VGEKRGKVRKRTDVPLQIQGILLFNFNLVHVPASHFAGPDALSRRLPASQNEYVSDDETWMDNTFILSLIPNRENFKNFCFTTPTPLPYNTDNIPSVRHNQSKAEQIILQIQKFLSTLELPPTESLQAKKIFLKKATEFYLEDGRMFKRNGTQLPLLVIQNAKKKLAILTQAHENLGHKGEQAVYELMKVRFFWPHMRTDVHHHISSCHECQICTLKKMEVSVTISAPVTIFEKVSIDVMYMPLSAQYRYIVADKDDLTRVTEASPLRKNNSKTLAKFFWEKIYCRYGGTSYYRQWSRS
jgi:hypothetical protein